MLRTRATGCYQFSGTARAVRCRKPEGLRPTATFWIPQLIHVRFLTLLFVGIAVGQVHAQEAPVVSFETTAPDATAPDATAPTDAPTLSFSFRFAPWESVLTKFAAVAGLTLDLTEVPPGTFNYIDNGSYTPREALDILNGYLLQRGFALVRRDRFLVCVNLEKGIPANLIPRITADQLADYGDNELVSVILSNPDMDASLAASQIGQLQGAHGKVVSLQSSNSLLVTDTGGNLRLIQRLLEQGAFARRANTASGSEFKAFALRYVRADDAERMIRTMFGLPLAAPTGDESGATPRTSDVNLTSDPRTNQLFVTAASAKLASIEQIVAAFDVPAETSSDASIQRRATTTRIIPLPQSDVITIGRALESLSPRIRVSTTHSAHGSTKPTGERSNVASGAADETTNGPRPAPTTIQAPHGRDM